jgi:hypothetical protein
MRYAWRAIKRQPVPVALGAVAVCGAIEFGTVGVIAHQDPRPGHVGDRHTVQEMTKSNGPGPGHGQGASRMQADRVGTSGDEHGATGIDSFPAQLRVERIAVAGNASDEHNASNQEIAVVLHVEKRDDPSSE